MAENYMKRYIALSKEFKQNNKSQETIGKLYDLMNLLEKDDGENDKTTLVYVYILLAHHKKAYDLYSKIYNKNDRKQKSKLCEMEQMANSHGDNFIVRPKKKQITTAEVDFIISDFSEKESFDEWKKYILNKKCIIFGQVFENEPLKIEMYKNLELVQYISKINEFIKWLGGSCKNELIKYYNKNMAEWTGGTADNDWYEEMEIFSISITINKDGNIFSDISCGDNIVEDHLLDMAFNGKSINSMNYDG